MKYFDLIFVVVVLILIFTFDFRVDENNDQVFIDPFNMIVDCYSADYYAQISSCRKVSVGQISTSNLENLARGRLMTETIPEINPNVVRQEILSTVQNMPETTDTTTTTTAPPAATTTDRSPSPKDPMEID